MARRGRATPRPDVEPYTGGVGGFGATMRGTGNVRDAVLRKPGPLYRLSARCLGSACRRVAAASCRLDRAKTPCRTETRSPGTPTITSSTFRPRTRSGSMGAHGPAAVGGPLYRLSARISFCNSSTRMSARARRRLERTMYLLSATDPNSEVPSLLARSQLDHVSYEA